MGETSHVKTTGRIRHQIAVGLRILCRPIVNLCLGFCFVNELFIGPGDLSLQGYCLESHSALQDS
jgi:hypothetical protein